MIIGVVLIAVAIVLLFFVSNNSSNSESSDSIQALSSAGPVIEQSKYDYFLEKYIKAERIVIEKADRDIQKVQSQIEATSDPTKKLFLQSYVDHYKYDYILRLINYSKYKDEDLTDELDPLFNQAAEKVVVNQKCDYAAFLDWFGYDMKTEKTFHILNQLKDCGIVDNSFEGKGYTVCVKNISVLNKIIRKANGHTLLSREDKLKLNEQFEQRRKELVGDHAIVSELLTDCPEPFAEVVRAYDALSSCNTKWEIVSSQSNPEAKSYANTLVDKKSIFSIYKQTFNFLKPCKDLAAPYFEFKQGGMSFYIYPEFVIAARSAINFEIIKIKDFTISFNKQNFVETSSAINPNSALIPKDAKLVRYTYKYVNKNGERDARYTNNPRYAVYEYGDITFLPSLLSR